MINPEHDKFCPANDQEGSICICGIIAAVRNDERSKVKAPVTYSISSSQGVIFR